MKVCKHVAHWLVVLSTDTRYDSRAVHWLCSHICASCLLCVTELPQLNCRSCILFIPILQVTKMRQRYFVILQRTNNHWVQGYATWLHPCSVALAAHLLRSAWLQPTLSPCCVLLSACGWTFISKIRSWLRQQKQSRLNQWLRYFLLSYRCV